MKRLHWGQGFALLLVSLFINSGVNAQYCDRSCLEGMVNDYLDALVAHDPDQLSLTDDVRFTENGVALDVGMALWKTATGIGTYKHYFADVEMGQVGFYGTIRENGTPAFLVLRLARESNGAISEIETLVIRGEQQAINMEEGSYPLPIWTETVPLEERLSREQLVRTADHYFTALEQQDGRGVYAFGEECNRLENSGYTTNAGGTSFEAGLERDAGQTMLDLNVFELGCDEQFKIGFFGMVTELHQRRFPVIDVERGVVFSMVFFDHDGKDKMLTLADGSQRASRNQNWTWQMGEAFKVEKGLIEHIEAWMIASQYHVSGGWSNFDRDHFGIVDMGGIGK